MIKNNTVIKLNKDDNYMILDNTTLNGQQYIYTVQVDNNLINSLGKYTFFKVEGNEVLEIEDDELLDNLYDIFTEKYLANWGV